MPDLEEANPPIEHIDTKLASSLGGSRCTGLRLYITTSGIRLVLTSSRPRPPAWTTGPDFANQKRICAVVLPTDHGIDRFDRHLHARPGHPGKCRANQRNENSLIHQQPPSAKYPDMAAIYTGVLANLLRNVLNNKGAIMIFRKPYPYWRMVRCAPPN